MDTDEMPTAAAPGTEPGAGAPADPSALLEHPLLNVVGLLFESAAGAAELLEPTTRAAEGMTGQLFEPLIRLARTDGGSLRMTDLAAQCRYSPSAVTRVSDRLELLGYATRRACPSDRRVVHLTITDEGRSAVAAAMPDHVRVIDSGILGALDDAERGHLEALLRKVRDAVHPCATAPVTAG